MPFGSTFVVTTASQPDPNGTLLLVTLKQTNDVLLQEHDNQPLVTPAVDTPAQHQALLQLDSKLSASRVDEVGRRYELHQPLPAGLLAVVISRCAQLCTDKVSVHRNAVDTVVMNGDVELCVTLQQSGLSSIDVFARCVAGGNHQTLLDKFGMFVKELFSVIDERWPGCTATEVARAAAGSEKCTCSCGASTCVV